MKGCAGVTGSASRRVVPGYVARSLCIPPLQLTAEPRPGSDQMP